MVIFSLGVGTEVTTCQAPSGVNLRSGPGTSYKVLTVLAPDTSAKITGKSGSWFKLEVEDGSVGWSYGRYLCEKDPLTEPTDPTPTDPTPTDPTDPTPAGCGEFASATARYVCSKDGNSRGKCAGGVPAVESCARGCLRRSSGDDSCMSTTGSWSCGGSYGTSKSTSGDYYTTSFGCWVDSSGTAHGDSGDNCIPACLSQARSSGLCQSGWSGKTCEQKVNWYIADSGRFGCLARVRLTNPKNGKAVVVVALDAGPACWVEAKVSKGIIDMSPPTAIYLFGTSSIGATEKQLVHAVEVDKSTPLGPI